VSEQILINDTAQLGYRPTGTRWKIPWQKTIKNRHYKN